MDKLLFINKILSTLFKIFNRRIRDAYQFMRILEKMEVPFDATFSGNGRIRIRVAGSLVLDENKSEKKLTAWLHLSSFTSLNTSSESPLDKESLTIDEVVLYCNSYHEIKGILDDK